jgi:SAM-dependent methyltransferase
MEAAKIGMSGHQPTVKIEVPLGKPIDTETVRKLTGITEEKEKYLKCWNVPEYRLFSPGEENLPLFLEAYEDVQEDGKPLDIVDWGCGCGRASLALFKEGFNVTAVDFAENCLDEEVRKNISDVQNSPKLLKGEYGKFSFVEHDLSKKIKLRSQFGYCCDVMEHIPPEQVDDVLEVILENSRNVFLQISTQEDHFGRHPGIGHPLHLSVHGYQWWLKKLVDHGCVIHRSMERLGHVIFFVSGYTGFSYDKLSHNTELEAIHDHMRDNAEFGFPNIRAYEEQKDVEVVLLAGGPSLNSAETMQKLDEFKRRRDEGESIHFVTMNGSHKWAFDEGYWPVTQFMIDARAFNARFVQPIGPENKYIISSQCHPDILKSLHEQEHEQTYLWQVNITHYTIPLIEELWGKMYEDWFPCPGGSSVMLRVLPQLQQMGFRKIHVFGFDSCEMDEEHHAYPQKENAVHPGAIIDITPEIEGATPKTFRVHPWMLAQAKEFIDMKETILRHLDITVYGDGLIAYLLEHGADVLPQE